MNVNSSLYKEVEIDIIRKILREKLGISEECKVELMDGGMFNTTYKAVGTKGKWILRFGPVNRHLLMGFEEHLMTAEEYVYTLCRDRGISCPQILLCDTSRKLLNRDYMITKFEPGRTMLGMELSTKDRDLLYEEMGQYAAAVHQITGGQFGFVSRITAGKGSQSWGECLLQEAQDIVEKIRSCDGISKEEGKRLLGIFSENREFLDKIKVPRLLHTDLWDGNVLITAEGGTPHIHMVIDGDRAMFGDEDFEWAAPWTDIPAVRRGAGIKEQDYQSPDRVKRRKIYRLFYNLLECYVGVGEYNNPQQYRNARTQVLLLADKLEGPMSHKT
ncbi:MAG: aminoglycoside phosphotransferase family protein [Eubacteriales bacterium]|nr:aminoglycoside phosphotransferase family protein [Eubacteriales bacterium]